MKKIILALSFVLFILPSKASDLGYFGFEPEIVTNYIATKKKLGFVRFSVELMITDSANLDVVEHHAPLLRDAIIDIVGSQPESKIKSITGREDIKKMCEDKVKDLLKKETGQTLVKKLLITHWQDE